MAAAALLAAACSVDESTSVHRSSEYFAFRERFPELLEPNYLPFMAYPLEAHARGFGEALRRWRPAWLGGATPETWLVFCRFADRDLPLRVFVAPPALRDDLDELRTRAPEEYVVAVDRALRLWERALEGRVAFERVESARSAQLRLRILGERAPVAGADRQVLGTAALRRACQVMGGDPESGRLDVRYRVSELRLYVADQHGLLLPDQVERVALHELGHALGMAGHSPVPGDLMYEVARDRISRDGLGTEDVNSFLSLYSIPNGTVYRSLSAASPAQGARVRVPAGPPRLHLAPHVDTRLGFEIQTPQGWTRVETPFGMIVVDGVSWDYQASLQVVVRRFDSLEAYLERYGRAHVGASRVLDTRDDVAFAGVRGKRVVLATPRESIEEITFLESADGRVIVVTTECPVELHDAYASWFEAALGSLELADPSRSDEDREYWERQESAGDPADAPAL